MQRFVLFLLLLGSAATATAQTPLEMHFVPIHPTASDRVTVLLEGTGCPIVPTGRDLLSGRIILSAVSQPGPCPSGPWASETSLDRLAAGSYVIELRVDGESILQRELVVFPGSSLAVLYLCPEAGECLQAGLEWSFPGTTDAHRAVPVEISQQAGYFWFFSPGNPEVTVKIVDGTAINGHVWLFLSSLTTLPFTLTVADCDAGDPPQCQNRTYRYPGGRGRLIIDLGLR
ncbi:MAG TPA: hypothetical protein VF121_15375 [Thermoanaerobaculia bacterium]|nr:hypothetical protein [Thermoanaerobaculia bacterium]